MCACADMFECRLLAKWRTQLIKTALFILTPGKKTKSSVWKYFGFYKIDEDGPPEKRNINKCRMPKKVQEHNPITMVTCSDLRIVVFKSRLAELYRIMFRNEYLNILPKTNVR